MSLLNFNYIALNYYLIVVLSVNTLSITESVRSQVAYRRPIELSSN